MARTIESPGVEIREIDLSNISTLPIGTNILLQGFASQGPVEELLNITSIKEFEQIYGAPTAPAERYFYESAKQILQSPGRLIVNRLPYGTGTGEGTATERSALFYPFVPVLSGGSSFSVYPTSSPLSGTLDYDSGYSGVVDLNTIDSDNIAGFILGKPILVPNLSASQVEQILNGQFFSTATSYSSGAALALEAAGNLSSETGNSETLFSYNSAVGMVVINSNVTNVEENFTGYYLAVNDNSYISDTSYGKFGYGYTRTGDGRYTKFEDIDSSQGSVTLIGTLSGTISTNKGSLSEQVEIGPAFSTTFAANSGLDYKHALQFSLWKFYQDVGGSQGNNLKLGFYTQVPSFLGSFVRNFKDTLQSPTRAEESVFAEDSYKAVGALPWMDIKINPNIVKHMNTSKFIRMWTGSANFLADDAVRGTIADSGFITAASDEAGRAGLDSIDGVYAIGPYAPSSGTSEKKIGTLVSKLERGLLLAENVDLLPLELVLDAGLSTINAATKTDAGLLATDTFDDAIYFNEAGDDAGRIHWQTVFNALNTFCESTRKDCMCIVDPIRHIFVQGADIKVLDQQSATFSQNILTPMRNLMNGTNSSYAALYGNWVKAFDSKNGVFFWAPFSGFQAAIMARMDALLQPWFAPAGLNNGIIRNIVDIAINPNQRERDLLYRYSINPITQFPRDGYVVFGQKTTQAKPSAFDRINVRRLFLFLEKATRQIAKYFVFEPNTVFTRTRFVNVLTPIFDLAKRNQGVYDYLIVCDERNNTPDVIDRNELVVDIYIKPVRTAEFILINFIATRTGANFEEIIAGTGA